MHWDPFRERESSGCKGVDVHLFLEDVYLVFEKFSEKVVPDVRGMGCRSHLSWCVSLQERPGSKGILVTTDLWLVRDTRFVSPSDYEWKIRSFNGGLELERFLREEVNGNVVLVQRNNLLRNIDCNIITILYCIVG